jgi:hypothetical protein
VQKANKPISEQQSERAMKATIQEAAEPTMKGIEVKKCWEKDDTEKMNESDGKRSE